MDKEISRIVKSYIDVVVVQQPRLISAYIFGSYAKNKERSESDIDIAFVIDNLADNEIFDTQVKLMLLASQIDNRIEPHPISKQDVLSNNPFAVEIIRTGIELKLK